MSLIRGDNSIFFALGLDNDNLKKDADQASEAISSMAKEITKLGQKASKNLEESLKEGLDSSWLYSEGNAFVDELNKVLGSSVKFDSSEFDQLSESLNAASTDIEQTVVLWDFLHKKIRESKGSNQGLKDLIDGVNLLQDHFKSMGVSVQEVMSKVQKSIDSGAISKKNPFVASLKNIQEDSEKFLDDFTKNSIGKIKQQLSSILGKDIKIETKGFETLDKILRSSSNDLERITSLSSFFKEKISSIGKDTTGIKKLSSTISEIESQLKSSGVSVDVLYDKIKKRSFSLPKIKGGSVPYSQIDSAELSSSIRGMQDYKQSVEGVKTAENTLQTQYRNTIAELANLRKEGKENELEYDKLKEKATELKSVLSSTYKEIESSSKGKEGLTGLISTTQGIVGAFGAAQGAAALFGGDSKDLETTLIKLNGIIAILNSLQSVQISLTDKNSAAFRALAKVKSLYAIATDSAALASTRLSAALKLLGWGVVVGGIAAAIKGYKSLTKKINKKNEESRISINVQKQAKESTLDEITHIRLLVEQAKNEKATRSLRIKALNELKNTYPEYLNFLSLDNIHSKNAARSIDIQTQAILKRAKARAYEEKIAEIEKKRIKALAKGDEEYLGFFNRSKVKFRELLLNAFNKGDQFEKEKKQMISSHKNQIEKNKAEEVKKYEDDINRIKNLIGKDFSLGKIDFSSEKQEKPIFSTSRNRGIKKSFTDIIKSSDEAKERVRKSIKEIEKSIKEGYAKIALDKKQSIIDNLESGFEKEKAYLDKERFERESKIEREKESELSKVKDLEIEKKNSLDRLKEYKQKGFQSSSRKESSLIKEIENKQKNLYKKIEDFHGKAIESSLEKYDKGLNDLHEKYKGGTLSSLYEKKKNLEGSLGSLEGKEAIAKRREEANKIQDQIDALEGKRKVISDIIDYQNKGLFELNEELKKQKGIVLEKQKSLELSKSKGDSYKTQNIYANELKEAIKIKNEIIEIRSKKIEDIASWINFGSNELTKLTNNSKEFLGLQPKFIDNLRHITDFITGVSQAVSGVVSKNPMLAIQGSIQALISLFSSELVSKTKEYEKSIRDLNDSFELLQRRFKTSFGQDKGNNILQQIENRRQSIENLEKLINSEKNTVLIHYFAGFETSRESGTDWEKVRQYRKEIEEERDSINSLEESYNEVITNTNANNIADALISVLQKGENYMESFKESFDDMVRATFFRKIKTDLIDKQSKEFFDIFSDHVNSNNRLTSWEINNLRSRYEKIGENAKNKLDEYNKIIGESGIKDNLTESITENKRTKREGISAHIKSVTEETAGKLEGIINNIRISQIESNSIQNKMERHLFGIYNNTNYLNGISISIRNIENRLLIA